MSRIERKFTFSLVERLEMNDLTWWTSHTIKIFLITFSLATWFSVSFWRFHVIENFPLNFRNTCFWSSHAHEGENSLTNSPSAFCHHDLKIFPLAHIKLCPWEIIAVWKFSFCPWMRYGIKAEGISKVCSIINLCMHFLHTCY
jgi:hypothetical protein